MDTATVSVLRRVEPALDPASPKGATSRKLTVTAVFSLSEAGRKASLLNAGDGRAMQQVEVEVPANRLHLVNVDDEGNAHLKLRPRYDVKPDGRVAKIDTVPVYDQPPTIEELFLAAARNHELERAYRAQGGRRARQRETLDALRAQLAEAFLTNPDQRALVAPSPTEKRCFLNSPQGRVLFDANRDGGAAREVPAEAHRRFRADERSRRQSNMQERARRLALHDEKKRAVGAWVTERGTPDQRERYAAGLLPMAEVLEAMADEAFAALRDWPLYVRNGPEVMQAHVRRYLQYQQAVLTELDLAVVDADAVTATADQWARAQEARKVLPDATVTLRSHRLTWRCHPEAPPLTLYGLLVVCTVGPIVLRREFGVPQ
jgi:hypothetical protein